MRNITSHCALVATGIIGLAAAAASAGVEPSTSTTINTWGSPTPATRTYLTPDVPVTALSSVPEQMTNNRLIAQTFRVSTNITMDKVALLGTGAAGDYTVHLFDVTGGSSLGGSYRPSTDGPAGPPNLKGVDLLAGGGTNSFTFGGNSANVLLTLDFTGASEISLTAGEQYALELWPSQTTAGSTGSVAVVASAPTPTATVTNPTAAARHRTTRRSARSWRAARATSCSASMPWSPSRPRSRRSACSQAWSVAAVAEKPFRLCWRFRAVSAESRDLRAPTAGTAFFICSRREAGGKNFPDFG